MNLYSQDWASFSGLRLRWARDVTWRIESLRGEICYWLCTATGHKSLRFNQAAWEIIGRLDGKTTLDEIWKCVVRLHGDAAATQSEVQSIVLSAIDHQLLEGESLVELNHWLARKEQSKQQDEKGRFSAIGLRWELGCPQRLIARASAVGRVISHPIFLLIGLAICLGALSSLLTHWAAWKADSASFLFEPTSWLLMLAWAIPIKLVHELSHSLVAFRFGVETRRWGISWMLIYPAPFVDISAAQSLQQNKHRIAISSAGVVSELLIASLAFIVWANSEPGGIRTHAMAITMSAGLMTLLFNANPFIRMDGYYVMTDWLRLPNLAQRSQRYWQDRILSGLGLLRSTQARESMLRLMKGERIWLSIYAPSAWLWRASIYGWAISWADNYNRWLVFALLIAAFIQLVAQPLLRLAQQIKKLSSSSTQVQLAISKKVILLGSLLLGLFLIPVPDREVQTALWWIDERYQLKALSDGQIVSSETDHLGRLSLTDPKLLSQQIAISQRLAAAQIRQQQAMLTDRAQAAEIEQEINTLSRRLEILQERIERLKVGPLISSNESIDHNNLKWIQVDDLPGRWVKEGELLGYWSTPDAALVRWVSPQAQVGRFNQLKSVKWFYPNQSAGPATAVSLALTQPRPAAIEKLPSRAFSETHGGSTHTDPLDKDHLTPSSPSFLLEAKPESVAALPHGARAWVVMDFGYRPIALQLSRTIAVSLRTRFSLDWV